MSRGGTKQTAPALCGHVTGDFGNTGLSASVTVPLAETHGPDGIASVGDLLVLIHAVDSTTATVGAPNIVGNPWTPVLTPDGDPVDHTATGATGAIRLRLWWKLATAPDLAAPATYTVTNSTTAHPGLGVRIIPAAAIGPGTLPLVAAVRTATGGPGYAPDLALPDAAGAFRDQGLLAAIVAYPHDIDRSIFYNGPRPSARYSPADWTIDRPVFAGPAGLPDSTEQVRHTVRWDAGLALETLDGARSQRFGEYTGGSNTNAANIPHVGATFLIRPHTYPAPTDGADWSDLSDTFDDPATLAGYETAGSPTIDDGQLALDGGDTVISDARVDFTRRQLTVDLAPGYDATAVGAAFQVALTDGTLAGARTAITLTTVPDPESPTGAWIRFGLVDDGYGVSGDVVAYGPDTRWWRLREEAGTVVVDTSPDGAAWRTAIFYEHTLLADQLATLRLTLAAVGPGTARVNTVDTAAGPDTRSVPFESTWAFMGAASPALREQWHGRDVLMGVVDQGTTAAVRTAQNVTMTRRTYLMGTPPGGGELFPGGVHGCLVTPCAVPTGGRFVEAVAFGAGDSTTITALMAGVRWCAEQGARVINVSAGGGGDHPIIAAVLGYIASNFDCEIYFSAGNDGGYGINLPAAYSTAFSNVHSVGAWNEYTNTLASFSNRHELISGVAPGDATGGRLPTAAVVTWRGTSASSPHAAQLCARIQTGRLFTAAQAGTALDRNTRDTGAPDTEQGGGAYDLTRALAIVGDPIGSTNVPAVAMPRFTHGQTVDVADGFNAMARAVELQGSLAVVRYRPIDPTTGLQTIAGLPHNFRGVVEWTDADADSYGGVWGGGPVLVAPADGMYLIVYHVRFGTTLIDGTTATGAPYNVGTRSAALLLNGTDYGANLIDEDTQPASAVGEGTTCVAAVIVPMYAEDWVYGDIYQTSGQQIQCMQDDWGGTWLGMARLSPLAPA